MFRTLLNPQSRIGCSPVGDRVVGIYKAVTESDGNRRLKKVGQRDIYEEIQSFAHECDISRIVTRYESGDENALNQRQGAYIDATIFPDNIHEAYEVIRATEGLYNSLSADLRQDFGSFSAFLEKFQNLENIKKYFDTSKEKEGEVNAESTEQ